MDGTSAPAPEGIAEELASADFQRVDESGRGQLFSYPLGRWSRGAIHAFSGHI